MSEWRSISTLPEYEASSQGTVRRKPVHGAMPHGGVRVYGGLERKGSWYNGRYIIVFRRKTYRVARLICEAFHGTPPVHDAVCMHIDENTANNEPSNLRWGSQKENLSYRGFKAKRAQLSKTRWAELGFGRPAGRA